MRNGPVARHTEGRFGWVCLEPRDQAGKILCIDSGADGDAEFKSCQQRHGHEILVTIEAWFGLHHRQQEHGRPSGNKYRCPISVSALDRLRQADASRNEIPAVHLVLFPWMTCLIDQTTTLLGSRPACTGSCPAAKHIVPEYSEGGKS